MAKYRIFAQQVSYLYIDVEADSIEEAEEMYDELDGGDFTEDIASCYWELSHIVDENNKVVFYR